MGFWGWVKGKYEEAKEAVRGKVEQALDWLEGILGESKPLEDSSSADQVNDINEILLEYGERYRGVARDIENGCLTLIQERFEATMDLLTGRAELRRDFKQEIKSLRRRHKELCDMIPDAITDVVARRVSIDDSECRSILALAAGDSKRYKLYNFCKSVVRRPMTIWHGVCMQHSSSRQRRSGMLWTNTWRRRSRI